MSRLLCFLCAPLLFLACAKTESGEKNRWQNNQNMIQGLAAEYPAFKTVLMQKWDEATALMEEAKKVSDEEERIEAMSDANRALNVRFINELKTIDEKIKEIRELSREALKSAKNRTEEMLADVASRNADQTVDAVQASLRSPDVTDEFDANRRLEKAKDMLDDATNTLKKVITETSTPEPVDTSGEAY